MQTTVCCIYLPCCNQRVYSILEEKVLFYTGTMQTLEVRNMELFLCDGYQNASWDYELIGSYKIDKSVDAASGGIFDLKHIKDRAMAGNTSIVIKWNSFLKLSPVNTLLSIWVLFLVKSYQVEVNWCLHVLLIFKI